MLYTVGWRAGTTTLHAGVNYIPQSGTMNLATGNPSEAFSTRTQKGGKERKEAVQNSNFGVQSAKKNNAMENEWRNRKVLRNKGGLFRMYER